MARTNIAAVTPPLAGPGRTFFPALPVSAGTLTLAMTAADSSNGNFTAMTDGRLYLLCLNSDASAHTVTITSVADGQNRTGDITSYSIAAGGLMMAGPFTTLGWTNPASPGPAGLWYTANSALVLITPLVVPT
jgi:hypothetical protein